MLAGIGGPSARRGGILVALDRGAWGGCERVLMVSILCVGAGGFIGSVARYLMGFIPCEGDFPLATFLVNLIGAVAIGFVAEAAGEWRALPDEAALFLKTGVCGGFTTFSTFSLETLGLLGEGRYALGALYAGGSLAACVAGAAAGMALARILRVGASAA